MLAVEMTPGKSRPGRQGDIIKAKLLRAVWINL